MNDDDARAFLRQWWEGLWGRGDLALVDELVGDRYLQHSARGNIELDRDELKERMVQYQRVLHTPATTVDAYVIDGDRLWIRATSRGANLETNGPSVVTWMVCYRFESGRVVEGWIATVPDVDWTR